MSILYIESKIKEKEEQKKMMQALSDIGLEPEELPDFINKEDTLKEYQKWVIERFFPEYELNNKVIRPKFGDKKGTEK